MSSIKINIYATFKIIIKFGMFMLGGLHKI